MSGRWLGLAAALALPAAARAQEPAASPPDVVAIVGGRVLTAVPGQAPIEAGTVLVRAGRIEAVGPGVAAPAGARVVRAEGCWVTPGFVETATHLGLMEIEMVEASRDTHEKGGLVLPHVRVLDAFNAESEVIPVARVNGLTAALVVPEPRNVVSGQSALVHLDGRRPEEFLIRAPAAIHASISEASKREGDKPPSTRMGIVATLRKALVAAQEHATKLARHVEKAAERDRKRAAGEKLEGDDPEPLGRDLEKEAWLPVLRGEIPLVIRARRASDILLALEVGKEFAIRVVVDGATEGWRVADALAAAKAPVILGPITEQPDAPESLHAIYENAAKLHAAGVTFAITSRDTHNARNLPYEAGIAVANGLPWEAAFLAVTRRPAEILGVADRVGSLAPGCDADLVVWTGDPFQPRSVPKHVFIRGREIPLTNRQTELRDRYR